MTYTMNSKMKQGNVWLADVLFKVKRQTKQRPVIIVGNELALDVDVIIAPVTSQHPRNQFDVVLEYWKEHLLNLSKSKKHHDSEYNKANK